MGIVNAALAPNARWGYSELGKHTPRSLFFHLLDLKKNQPHDFFVP